MQLIQLVQSDKQDYNNFVASQQNGSFLQSWEWGEWQASQQRIVTRLKIADESGNWLGAVQFIQTHLFGNKQYLYAPYGPVMGDWRMEIRDWRWLFGELQKKYTDVVFVRLEPTDKGLVENLSKIAKKSINVQPGITMIQKIRATDAQLLAGMHNKTRYNIRVAQRHGVEVVVNENNTANAIKLIVETQIRQSYYSHSKQHYEQFLQYFLPHNNTSELQVRVYTGEYQGQALAAGIMVDFGKTRMYLHGGSSDEHRNLMAPYVLHWRALVDARNQGMEFYDFGGSEVAVGGEKGFTRFKQGFGGQVKEYAGAYDTVFQPLWYSIYTVLRKINRTVKQKE